MSFEKIIEEKIQKAISNGEFANLKGEGKPLNLDEYFSAPEDLRMVYALLKSNKFVPQEVDLLKEIGKLKEKLNNCGNSLEKAKLNSLLSEKELSLNIILERNKRKSPK